MSILNHNIPSFKGLVRKSYFTKNQSDSETYINVYVFGLQSCGGVILTFHVMTDDGMVRSRVPISEIYTKVPTNDIPFNFKQLWDCFSENVTVTTYDYLYDKYKIEVLYNWTSLINEENLKTNSRSKLGLKDKVVFFYGGNLGQAQDLQNIIRLASRIQNETSAHFLIVGDGTESMKLKKIISELQLKNISILKSTHRLFTVNQRV